MATEQSSGRRRKGPIPEEAKPDFLRAGVRCGVEMVLAGGLVLLVGLPAENDIYFWAVVALAVIVMVVVLFWALNRQMEQWIRAAR
jgi:predicted RND superfamily exporter protein